MEPTPTASLRFQLSRQADLASDLIALVGAGDFSHGDLVLDDGRLLGARNDAVGGAPSGVQIRTPGYARWEKQVIFEVPCTPLQKAVATDFAMKQIGLPYDREAILAFVVGRNWREPGAWFCTELLAASGEHGGLWHGLYSPDNKIAPNAFALMCSATTGCKITVIR